MGKMKKIRLCIGILVFTLMMPMSGCSVSISFGTNKDTESEKEEKTEKKTEMEDQEGAAGISDEALKSQLEECYQRAVDSGSTYSDRMQYFSVWKANARGVDLNRNFDALELWKPGRDHGSRLAACQSGIRRNRL